MTRLTKGEMVRREVARRDAEIAAAEAYYQTDAGVADRRRLYAREFARIAALEALEETLPDGWDAGDLSDADFARLAQSVGCAADDLSDLYYGELDDLRNQVG